jgi:hypothetical protein
MQINLNGICADSSVTGFPLLIDLSSGNAVYNECRSDGLDIRFRDKDGNTIPFEIESWTLNGDSYIWVKVDFQSNTALDYIYIYFSSDSMGLIDRSDPAAVWSNGYVGVWHGKSADPLHDSSISGHVASTSGFTAPKYSKGKIGDAIKFGGGNYGFSIPAKTDINDLEALTFETWIRNNSSTAGSAIFSKGPLKLTVNSNILDLSAAHNDQLFPFTSNTSLLGGGWTDIAVTWNGQTQNCVFYAGGIAIGATIGTVATTSPDVGYDFVIGNDASKSNGITAELDEIRLSNVVRSGPWLAAQFKAQSGGALSFGSPEAAP